MGGRAEEGDEESEMTCSERLQAELQDDPGAMTKILKTKTYFLTKL